jgi:hypothetical protein
MAPDRTRGYFRCMSEPTIPSVPGWRFTVDEVSMGIYRVAGKHADGRTVERTDHDLGALFEAIAEDARNLPEHRHA